MHIAVVGPGLIGHSVTLALHRADRDARVVELNRGDAIDTLREVDLVVLATPIDQILALIREHGALLERPVVIDTGSTKQAIVRAARAARLPRFIGGHPMAGGTGGAAAARPDLFDGCRWFLVPAGANEGTLGIAHAFVERLGAIPVVLDDEGEEHDRVMAAVSHLPQAVASVLMSVVASAAGERLDWAGRGLRDTTRLAASSPDVWESVLSTNAAQLRPLLRETAEQLRRLADQLHEAQSVREVFARAQRARATLDA